MIACSCGNETEKDGNFTDGIHGGSSVFVRD